MITYLRFSSGDLSSECDDIDPNELPATAKPPLQQQPMPQGGGPPPPNIPPPPGKSFEFCEKIVYT